MRTHNPEIFVILEPWVAGSHADEILSSMGFGRFHRVGIIRDHLGYWIVAWIGGFSINIGHSTSVIAELWVVREGLILAWNMFLSIFFLKWTLFRFIIF